MSPSTDVLMRLGAATAEAVAKALDAICPEPVTRGDVAVLGGDERPFAAFDGPAVAVSVAYVDGVSGGNVLLITPLGARRIAAAMSGGEAPTDEAEPSELELSAVAEAANQMMAAAASATSVVLGQDVAVAPPETRVLPSAEAAAKLHGSARHATIATFEVCGEPCRFVQLVPTAFVVRMTRALGEQGAEQIAGAADADPGDGAGMARALDDALRDIHVRVWAELGRARVPLGHAPELPAGAVVELDRKAEDPVDLYVNGLRLASGRLVVTEDGEWALSLEEVCDVRESDLRPPAPASGPPSGDATTEVV